MANPKTVFERAHARVIKNMTIAQRLAEKEKSTEMVVSIKIPLQEYNQLKKDSMKLRALENSGVHSWEWYDEAMDELERIEAEYENSLKQEAK